MKSSASKADEIANLTKTVSTLENDIINFDIMYNMLTVYMATIQLPTYNKNRCFNYMQAMKVFSDGIVGNALA